VSDTIAGQYYVIPLSVQQEGDFYIVGNADRGDFYRFPRQGMDIIRMLGSGNTASDIKSRLRPENVDVDDFLVQLADIGFIHPENERQRTEESLQHLAQRSYRTFNVDARVARSIFSAPVLVCYLAIVLYACINVVVEPALRPNMQALYIETNRTLLLLVILVLSCFRIALHEIGHMLAAAREGIKSRYGISNRLWAVVAESDITGILALPKSRRYLPMLAGILVDILLIALFTILLDVTLQHDANAFVIQVIQILVLETMIAIAWQFNIFVKTDIYFVLCNYFSHPDLDKDARIYLRQILYHLTLGRLGSEAPLSAISANLTMLRAFSLIWLFGRLLSLTLLFTVFLPTMWRYIQSAAQLLKGPPTSVWAACDTLIYVSIVLTMLGVGMYMWLRRR
jgi:hypothetical protein